MVLLENDEAWTILDFSASKSMVHGSSLIVPVYSNMLVMVYINKRSGWEFPGGKQLPGESALDAAKRELLEETGLKGYEFDQICTFELDKGGILHYGTIFRCQVEDFEPLLSDRQSLGIGLFSSCPANLSINDGYIQLIFDKFGPYAR